MRIKYLLLASTAIFALGACSEKPQTSQTNDQNQDQEPVLETQLQKYSYVIGVDMGGQLAMGGIELDRETFAAGLADALDNRPPRIDNEELAEVIETFHAEQQAKQQAAGASKAGNGQADMTEAGKENAAEGKAFLAANADKEGVITTESGLQYKVITAGTGASPDANDQVSVEYRGTLVDGTEFDASEKHGGAIELNVGQVIPGWTEALQKMQEGSKWELYIPSNLAYGSNGAGGLIGPNATLIFEVELVKVMGLD